MGDRHQHLNVYSNGLLRRNEMDLRHRHGRHLDGHRLLL